MRKDVMYSKLLAKECTFTPKLNKNKDLGFPSKYLSPNTDLNLKLKLKYPQPVYSFSPRTRKSSDHF